MKEGNAQEHWSEILIGGVWVHFTDKLEGDVRLGIVLSWWHTSRNWMACRQEKSKQKCIWFGADEEKGRNIDTEREKERERENREREGEEREREERDRERDRLGEEIGIEVYREGIWKDRIEWKRERERERKRGEEKERDIKKRRRDIESERARKKGM